MILSMTDYLRHQLEAIRAENAQLEKEILTKQAACPTISGNEIQGRFEEDGASPEGWDTLR